jgi:hypothetical protein
MFASLFTYSQASCKKVWVYMATFGEIFNMHYVACKIFHFMKL